MISEPPFEDYDCYKVFHKGMKRWQVCLIKKGNRNERKTILYSKFLMSKFHGRILHQHEEVDHIDGNKLNDSFENLEIVTRKENVKRRNEMFRAERVELICPNCMNLFIRIKSKTHLVDNKNNKNGLTFCLKPCVRLYYKKK